MSKIMERLDKYKKENEKYKAKVEKIREQIKELEQQCTILTQEDTIKKREAFQSALAFIEETSKDPAIKDFARRCVGFRSFQEMEATIETLYRYGFENLKVGGEIKIPLKRGKGVVHKSFSIKTVDNYLNNLAISVDIQTGVIQEIKCSTSVCHY